MNILILNWKDIKNPDVGGAEIIVYELAKRLVNNGHVVTWFCRHFADSSETETIDGIRTIRRGNRITVYLEAYLYYRSLRRKPDLVIDCINTICWQTPLYVPEKKRVAYVNQLAKEVFFYELPKPLAYLAYALESWEYKSYKYTNFISYSDSVKKDIATFGIPLSKIKTFPLGVDHERYFPGEKSRIPLFIFVARLVKMKRPELCIRAIKIVVERYPQTKLAIIGYGPEENYLENLIKQLHLKDNIFLANKNNLFFTKHAADIKVRLMREAWVLLLPSVKEGWGMVVTEAAACGTPSIVTNVTGLRDSVRNGITGIVLPEDVTVQKLAQAMLRMIEQPKLRKEMSLEAVKWSQNFDWDKSYRRFCSLLSIKP